MKMSNVSAVTVPMSTGSSRTERRKKWMQQHRKGTREGLRDRTVAPTNNKKPVYQAPVITIKNKGGFRTSELTQKYVINKTVNSSNHSNSKIPSKSNVKNKVKSNVQKSTPNKVKNKNKAMAETNSGSSEASPSKHIPHKYILFVGNLPTDVTKEQLEEHFRKTGGVKSIRIPKEKGTDKGRGFAYIEFRDRISHGIALRLHHTTLDGKKINVEFTSAGSGKSEKRKEKLKQKNNSLAKFKIPYNS